MEPINISSEDLDKLQVIGKGTEGTIYKLNNNTLLKIYHYYMDYSVPNYKPIYDEEGVNITPVKSYYFKNTMTTIVRNTVRYYNKEGVSLSREDAIINAILRQKNIKYTQLPKNRIYVDKRLKGCVLHYHKRCTDIYKTLNLPYKLRLSICRQLLEKYKELIDNNIYHIDLAQAPDAYSNNTNVLLSYRLKPEIIDIDGQSAIYTEEFNNTYYHKSLFSLNNLIIELLSRLDLSSYLNEELDAIDYEEMDKRFPVYMLEDFKNDTLTLEKTTKYLK